MSSRTINNLRPNSGNARHLASRCQDGEHGPSRKRSRAASDDESDFHVEHDLKWKRPRASMNVLSNADAVSDTTGSRLASLGDFEDGNTDVSPESSLEEDDNFVFAKTQYEDLRDQGFIDLRHEEEDDRRATQAILKAQELHSSQNGGNLNVAAECGIIESITCVNFMCHEHLHCELGPNLNFVVGENGSGKSAILTALTICLGGKASSTNRGGNLRGFIKEGRDRSVVSVKIKNQGEDGYRRDDFGDSIILERFFNQSGTNSGFKLKSAAGRIVSTSREEVEDLKEFFGLQVDNPLNVLTQDNARSFLNASSKSQKYEFFVRGVQLQQLDADYKVVAERLDETRVKYLEQLEEMKELSKEYAESKKLKQMLDGNEKLRIKHKTLQNQAAWVQVREEERELVNRINTLHEATIKISQAEEEAAQLTQGLEAVNFKIGQLEQKISEAKRAEAETVEELSIAEMGYNKVRKEQEQLLGDEREARTQVNSASKRVGDLKAKVDDEKRRLKESTGETHARKSQQLTSAKDKAMEMKKEIEGLRSKINEHDQAILSGKTKVTAATEAARRQAEVVQKLELRHRDLRKEQGSPYDAYPPQMHGLVRQINQKAKRFSVKPIGPIGTHIQLLKSEWSRILESIFGDTLNGFIVSNKADEKELRSLIARSGMQRCPILIIDPNRAPLNTEGKEPDIAFDTILRVLKMDNTTVRDQLIISNSIEQVLLIRQRLEAERILLDDRNPPPRNAKACLTFHDGLAGLGLRYQVTGGGASTSTVKTPVGMRPRMRTDLSSQLAESEKELAHHRGEYERLERERTHALAEQQRRVAEAKSLHSELHNLKAAEVNQRGAINRLEEEMDGFEGIDERLQSLESQLVEAKEKEEHYGSQYGSLAVQKQEKTAECKAARQKVDEAQRVARDLEANITKMEAKLAKKNESRSSILRRKNDAMSGIEIAKEDKEVAEARLQKQQDVIQRFTQECLKLCPDRPQIPEEETLESIEGRYKAITAQLEKQERRQGMTNQQAFKHIAAVARKWKAFRQSVDGNKILIDKWTEALDQRHNKWRMFRRMISAHARINFLHLLSERNFRGRLLIDHEHRALDCQVEPDRNEQTGSGRGTKTLSGGEKSFTSICILLAIWEAMGSPLRCLDEFDVFMDNVNRAISTNMLISQARKSVSRQYIFITPNAIDGRVTLGDDVKITRLTDPRQRTMSQFLQN